MQGVHEYYSDSTRTPSTELCGIKFFKLSSNIATKHVSLHNFYFNPKPTAKHLCHWLVGWISRVIIDTVFV